MHYGSLITAFRATNISYSNKKLNSCLGNGRIKFYSRKFLRTSIMSHGNKTLLFQFLNLIIAFSNAIVPW